MCLSACSVWISSCRWRSTFISASASGRPSPAHPTQGCERRSRTWYIGEMSGEVAKNKNYYEGEVTDNKKNSVRVKGGGENQEGSREIWIKWGVRRERESVRESTGLNLAGWEYFVRDKKGCLLFLYKSLLRGLISSRHLPTAVFPASWRPTPR